MQRTWSSIPSQGTKTWQGQKKKVMWPVMCCNAEVLRKISSAGQSYIKCSIPLNYSCCHPFPAVTWAVRQRRSMLIRRASVTPGQIQPFPLSPSLAFPYHLGCQTPKKFVTHSLCFLWQVLGRPGILQSDGYLGCVLYRWIFLEQAVCGREKS